MSDSSTLKKILPAVAAALVIIAVLLYAVLRHPDAATPAAAEPAAEQPAAAGTAARREPPSQIPAPATDEPVESPPSDPERPARITDDYVAEHGNHTDQPVFPRPYEEPPPLTSENMPDPETIEATSDKYLGEPLRLEEKLDRTKQFLERANERVKLLEEQLRAAKQSGDDEAARKTQVRLDRLRARIERYSTAVEEGRDPKPY